MKLVPIEQEHLSQMLRWRNDPAIYKWCRQFEPIGYGDHYRWFDSLTDRKDVKMYGIFDPELRKQLTIGGEEGDIVGVCGLTDLDYINSRAEFSLYIGTEHQSKGYGKGALSLLLDKAFKDLNLNQVWGESFAHNPAHALFEKLGFEMTGMRPKHYYREGHYVDALLFSIMRDQWLSK